MQQRAFASTRPSDVSDQISIEIHDTPGDRHWFQRYLTLRKAYLDYVPAHNVQFIPLCSTTLV